MLGRQIANEASSGHSQQKHGGYFEIEVTVKDGKDPAAVEAAVYEEVERLKQEPGTGLYVGGVTLPLALTELGLIDEYEIVVHPRLAGHGPTLFAGLSKPVDLELVGRLELGSGAVALRYVLRR